MSIRIVLADDHPIVLQGLQQLFERQGDFDVLCCCSDGAAALDAVRERNPDVLVLDLRMPGKTGLDVLRMLSTEHMKCRTVLLTAAVRDEEVVELGANPVRELVREEVLLVGERLRVRRHADRDLESRAVVRAAESTLDRESSAREAAEVLTPRELEIVRMVAQGLRNKAIASRLSISEATVKVHLHNIYEKFGVDGRLELVLSAQQKGLA